MKAHNSQSWLCDEQHWLQSNMTVCPRLFEFLTTLKFGAPRKKSHCVNNILDHREKNTKKKNKNNETSSSTCGQQCIMKCQEHNRSKKRDVASKKNQAPTSMAVPQIDICNRPQITTQGIHFHYGLNCFKKKVPHQITNIKVFISSKTIRSVSVIISVLMLCRS